MPRRRPEAPRVEVVYERPPDDVRRYRQELLLDGEDVKITLLLLPPDAEPLRIGDAVELPGGSALLWFTFPGRWHEVAAFHDPSGALLGHYTNVVRPPRIRDSRWRIRDLFLDVWLPPGGPPRVLDREEFREARERGWLEPGEGVRADRECDRILGLAREGRWPPRPVREWPLEAVPALRMRRDEPGTYYASLLSGRVIAWGLYLLGTVSLTVLAFAVLTGAFEGSRAAQTALLWTLAAEGLLLLPLALGGLLPATRRPHPGEALTDERSFFIAALAVGLAVLLLNESDEWRPLLAGLYATLSLFLLIFAVCRAWFDRVVPLFAVSGLAVCVLAFLILL